MGTDNYSYDYDPIGNRVQAAVSSGQSTITESYAANKLNQYDSMNISGSTKYFSHDYDGNLVIDRYVWYHTYDAENRLIRSEPFTTPVDGDYILEHKYNQDHQRIETVTKQYSGSVWNTIKNQKYIYDGWNLITEVVDDQTTVITNVYVWGLDLSGTLQGAGGVGGLLSQTEITPTSSSVYFPLADANGNCVTYSDNAGNVQAHYEYDAFGNTISSDGDMDDDFHIRFSSKYLDDETGLYYYGFRYYTPALGRWMNRDPIEEKGGYNLYGLVGNDGVNIWDYLGLKVKMIEFVTKQESTFYLDRYKTKLEELKNKIGPLGDEKFRKIKVSWGGIRFTGSLSQFLKLIEYEVDSEYKNDSIPNHMGAESGLNEALSSFITPSAPIYEGGINNKTIYFVFAHGDDKNKAKSIIGDGYSISFNTMKAKLKKLATAANAEIAYISCFRNSKKLSVKFNLGFGGTVRDGTRIHRVPKKDGNGSDKTECEYIEVIPLGFYDDGNGGYKEDWYVWYDDDNGGESNGTHVKRNEIIIKP